MTIKQGDIWWIKPSPLAIGSEQQGRRPALILQNDPANQHLNTTVVALISSSGQAQTPEMLPLGPDEGLAKACHADFAQIFTIDKSRLEKKVGQLSPDRWSEVQVALGEIFYRTVR